MATCCIRWLPLLCSEHMYPLWELKLLLQQALQRGRMTNLEEEKCCPDLHKEETLDLVGTWWGGCQVTPRYSLLPSYFTQPEVPCI